MTWHHLEIKYSLSINRSRLLTTHHTSFFIEHLIFLIPSSTKPCLHHYLHARVPEGTYQKQSGQNWRPQAQYLVRGEGELGFPGHQSCSSLPKLSHALFVKQGESAIVGALPNVFLVWPEINFHNFQFQLGISSWELIKGDILCIWLTYCICIDSQSYWKTISVGTID